MFKNGTLEERKELLKRYYRYNDGVRAAAKFPMSSFLPRMLRSNMWWNQEMQIGVPEILEVDRSQFNSTWTFSEGSGISASSATGYENWRSIIRTPYF